MLSAPVFNILCHKMGICVSASADPVQRVSRSTYTIELHAALTAFFMEDTIFA